MSLSFTYGDYPFSPRPLLSINSEPLKTPDGVGYGIIHSIALDGDLLTTGLDIDGGITGVFDKIETLKDALDHDGKLLLISCDSVPIISGYPTIEGYSFDRESDNYTRRASYNIEFKMPETNINPADGDVFNSSVFPPYIESCSETWDVEFQDERLPFEWTLEGGTDEKFGYVVAVTHTVDVTARIAYTGDRAATIPWQDAKAYATGKLGFDNEFVTLTGILGLPSSTLFTTSDVFNQFRQVSTNKTDGTISVVETFIVTPSGADSLPNNAIETFDISSNQGDGITTVGIQGEIKGLASITYDNTVGMNVTSSKYSAASGYYNVVKDRMYDRARTAYSGIRDDCFNRNLNPQIKTRAVAINPIEGTISYDYQYDTTIAGCITGECIVSQSISIDDNLPTDVFASQTILGRAAGPILQDIGTTTVRTRTVNIELVTLPPTGCGSITSIYEPIPTGQIADFIAVVSGDLAASYSQVFVSAQSQSWNFSVGRYTKNIGFTYNNCSS